MAFEHPVDKLGRRLYLFKKNGYGQNLDRGPYKALSQGAQVVSVKTKKGIYRAIQQRGDLRMVDELLYTVGSIDPTLEWTAYRYEGLPYYMNDGDRIKIKTGIFFFPVIDWPTQQFSYEGQLIRIPRGW